MKNSYDADATEAVIEYDPVKSRIVVSDNGHGMNSREFEDFWMRIGSRHKQRQKFSRRLKRSLTGSKGIGRLAVQYLASKLTLTTVSQEDPTREMTAYVNWDQAIRAGDLTEAKVEYFIRRSKQQLKPGTSIVLSRLKHDWDRRVIVGLAREIWWLQPPFLSRTRAQDESRGFTIRFASAREDYVEAFNSQIRGILDIWYARIAGKNTDGRVEVSLEFSGEPPKNRSFHIPSGHLRNGDFEIRIFHLQERQPRGIKVAQAREYLNEFGGVHVYDGGFHLPYYGDQKNDWLRIEFDHSHRLSASALLPAELQVGEGMTFLPTLSRIIGVVNVDTSREAELEILITRDRLQEGPAFDNLIYMVRWALDFYATEEARRVQRFEQLVAPPERPEFRRMEDVLTKYREEIPPTVFNGLRQDVKKATVEIESEAQLTIKRIGLLGPLATAGITSLAYQHELKLQFRLIDAILRQLEQIRVDDPNVQRVLGELKDSLSAWVMRAENVNALFSAFADAENLRKRERFLAKSVLEEVKRQVDVLSRGTVPISLNRVDDGLFLPPATFAEWSSIFQNVLVNALNAMMDSRTKQIEVRSTADGRTRRILVQDTGSGLDLKSSESLFEPFERKVTISSERRGLGFGGTGLGLTIVRLIAGNVGCEVSFVEPETGFSTAFCLAWKEEN